MSQVSDKESTVQKGIEKGAEAIEKGKRKLHWLEATYHTKVRELKRKVVLQSIAAIVATLGLGAWLFAAFFALEQTMSPASAAFLLGTLLLVAGGVCVFLSKKRVQRTVT